MVDRITLDPDLIKSKLFTTQRTQIEFKEDEDYKITIDAVVSESHSYSSEITEHNVETGADITDHSIMKPFKLSLSGVISDNPLDYSLADPLGLRASVFNQFDPTYTAPSKSAYLFFRDALDETALLTIYTGLEIYEDMLLESFDCPRSKTTAHSLKFSATFKQVTFVQSEEVDIPDEILTEPEKTSSNKNKGKKNKKKLDAGKEAKAADESSFIYDMTGEQAEEALDVTAQRRN